MEWMPLLAASRCAKVAMFAHPTNGEGIHGKGSHYRSRPCKAVLSGARQPAPTAAWGFARSFRARRSSPSSRSNRAASWRPAGARITGGERFAIWGMMFVDPVRLCQTFREAPKERRRTPRRFAKRRAGRPCASSRQDKGAASARHAVSRPRSSDAPTDAVDQRATWSFGVWRRRSKFRRM